MTSIKNGSKNKAVNKAVKPGTQNSRLVLHRRQFKPAILCRLRQALVAKDDMSAISQIVEKLKKYPELDYEQDESSISVNPVNGFTVWLTENGNSFTVGFSGWHEEFTELEEALNCFAFGLSDKCRLKVFKRGTSEYKWVVQALHENEWYDDSETGLLFFPFWRKKQVLILQNAVIGN